MSDARSVHLVGQLPLNARVSALPRIAPMRERRSDMAPDRDTSDSWFVSAFGHERTQDWLADGGR
jgi:hypothetical protein